MLKIKNYCFNPFQENGYLIWDDTMEGVIIDPGCINEGELEKVKKTIAEQGISIKAIWLTHGHFDHIYGVRALVENYGVPVRLSPEDKAIMDKFSDHARSFGMPAPDTSFGTLDIKDKDILKFGETEFEVISTPGHTPGGVCFYDRKDKVLFSGDTLFAGAIGRTDLFMGEYDQLIVSLMDKVMGIDGEVKVFPGHGPSTDISHERTHNPFLQPFKESPEELDWDEEGLEIHG